MLAPGWVDANHDRFDLFHVHFGFDACDPGDLRRLGAALERYRKPMVVTVHDLENPHHDDQQLHRTQLAALLAHADEVLTLTPGAAREIGRLFGRAATPVAHPHIVPFDRMPEPEPHPPGRAVTAGLHLKSLRRNMNALPVLDEMVETADDSSGQLRIRVDIHRDAWQGRVAGASAPLLSRLRTLAGKGLLQLRVHDFFTDAEFFDYIEGLDVSVLPYAFGTHSGWLEACRDLGTEVVAPACGFYAQQGRTFDFGLSGGRPIHGSVRTALESAAESVRRNGSAPLGASFRRRQRRAIEKAHLDAYRRASSRVAAARQPARTTAAVGRIGRSDVPAFPVAQR
jgi:hypothetical protein